MQIKNKKKFIIIYLLSFFLFNLNLNAEEFNITAKETLLQIDDLIVDLIKIKQGINNKNNIENSINQFIV